MTADNLGPIYQAAYVVPDLDAAIHNWVQVSGAGPFFVVPHFAMTDPRLYGKPALCDISIALGFSKGLCVELIQQHDDRPSVYRQIIDSGRYGFHHFARLADDIDSAIQHYRQLRVPCAFRASMLETSQLAYLDATHSLGCYVELVSNDETVRTTLARLVAAANGWDGSNPIRMLS